MSEGKGEEKPLEKTASESGTATAVDSSSSQQDNTITREELLELVRAIKFAKPNASIRNVHQEITQDLSSKEGFDFLANVKLNDVKRVWKKAQQQRPPPPSQEEITNKDRNSALMEKLPQGTVQLYTVGNASVSTLARNYTASAAAEAAAKEAQLEQEQEAIMKNYRHVFLDVPADRSGSRPQQAIISFHKKSDKNNAATSDKDENIVKIQAAATSQEEAEERYPMLLYNRDRSAKTFIHYDSGDDTYDTIHSIISSHGVGGALGSIGGTKAYFYSNIIKTRNGPNVVSINVAELAPPQEW